MAQGTGKNRPWPAAVLVTGLVVCLISIFGSFTSQYWVDNYGLSWGLLMNVLIVGIGAGLALVAVRVGRLVWTGGRQAGPSHQDRARNRRPAPGSGGAAGAPGERRLALATGGKFAANCHRSVSPGRPSAWLHQEDPRDAETGSGACPRPQNGNRSSSKEGNWTMRRKPNSHIGSSLDCPSG